MSFINKISKYGQIRIISSQKTTFWYSNIIGNIFWVVPYDDRSYQVHGDANWHGLIRKDDCKIIFSN